MSYASQVQTSERGVFNGNALRFATHDEAHESGADIARRWTLVTDFRVVESSDPVNYAIVDGRLRRIGE